MLNSHERFGYHARKGIPMKTSLAALALAALLGASSLPTAEALTPASHLKTTDGWIPATRERLLQFILHPGELPKGPRGKPVAVFDWDNTVVKNDVGDAVFFHWLAHDLVRRPTDWAATSPYLTDGALAALARDCDGAGARLRTSSDPACAETMLALYVDGKLADGGAAWKSDAPADTVEPAYAWAAALLAGMTRAEARKEILRALKEAQKQPVGAEQPLGRRRVTAWLRIYPQMRELVGSLTRTGFEVWVVSASQQWIVEAIAPEAGVPARQVIGIRPALDAQGRATHAFEGCGTEPTPTRSLISYRQGKRCWINRVILALPDLAEQMSKAGAIAFAAGDSDTDAFFLKDCAGLRLVINRNKPEILCHALMNADGRWLINPMFIQPKARRQGSYSCARFGLPDQVEKGE